MDELADFQQNVNCLLLSGKFFMTLIVNQLMANVPNEGTRERKGSWQHQRHCAQTNSVP